MLKAYGTPDELPELAKPMQGECGLLFKLVPLKGAGDDNCGQIVSGYDPATLACFTSTLHGNTLQFNSVGKLCKCNLSGNN